MNVIYCEHRFRRFQVCTGWSLKRIEAYIKANKWAGALLNWQDEPPTIERTV